MRQLAKTLGVSLDELMAEGAPAPRKRGPVSQIQQHLERISLLPKPKQARGGSRNAGSHSA